VDRSWRNAYVVLNSFGDALNVYKDKKIASEVRDSSINPNRVTDLARATPSCS
jgi:hypothetical protein